jgi:hypothetical protein
MNHGDVVTNEMNTASQQVAELAFRHPERNDSVDFLMDAVEIEATACREAIRRQVSNPDFRFRANRHWHPNPTS